MISTVEFPSRLHGLTRRRIRSGPRRSGKNPNVSETMGNAHARLFLGRCNFPVTHLLQRTSRVITCTNHSVTRRVTAILGATGETGQLMPRIPVECSPVYTIIPQPTSWGKIPFCTDVCIINHISYQMPIPFRETFIPKTPRDATAYVNCSPSPE